MKKNLMIVLVLLLSGCILFANGETEKVESVTVREESNVLTIYSPQGDSDRGGWIVEKCKEATGLEINFLCAGGGVLSERLIAEKANPQCDVVFGLVQTAMYPLKNQGILQSYVPSWASELDSTYKDKDGYFHCFWQTPIVMAYNKDFMATADAPNTWTDLAKPEYKDKFAIGGTGSQTTRSYLIGFLWDNVDKTTGEVSQQGWDQMQALYNNAATLPAGVKDYGAMKNGTVPIILSWFGGVKSNTAKNEIPVAFISPENGTPIVSEAIGIVSGTKNLENAKKFVEWFGSPAFMAEYANHFGQAPVHPEAIALCNDAVKADATMFKAQAIDWELASSKLNSWLEKIELEIMP